MSRKHADRPLYVTVPRDLAKQPQFARLSMPAQWLLQHLERDPYRLGCGVFVFNPQMVAKAARATVDDVLAWFDELTADWLIHDQETGEVWLTQHMEWDFTISSPNGAKGVLRDLKRVHSPTMCRMISALVLAKFPNLRENADIDPGWIEPPPDNSPEGASPDLPEGASGRVSGTPEPKPEPKPEALSTEHQPEARSTNQGSTATCANCSGIGILRPTGGGIDFCDCPAGGEQRAAAKGRLRVVGGDS